MLVKGEYTSFKGFLVRQTTVVNLYRIKVSEVTDLDL